MPIKSQQLSRQPSLIKLREKKGEISETGVAKRMQQVGFELKNKNNNIETFLKETDESMRECGRIR